MCVHTVDTGVQSVCTHTLFAPLLAHPCLGLNGGLIRTRHCVRPFTWHFSLSCPASEAWPDSACVDWNEDIVWPWADHSFCLALGCMSVTWVQGSSLAISRDEGALRVSVCVEVSDLGVSVDAHLPVSISI